MPYVVKGKTVYKKEDGHLVKVGTTKGSVKKYLAALHANADKGFYGHDNVESAIKSTGGRPKIIGS